MENKFNNVYRLFLKLLPVQILLVITSGLSSIINGLIIGNYFNANAMRALGLATPMMAFLSGLASIVSSGSTILCGKYMGTGDVKKIGEVFSSAMLFLFGIGLFLSISIFLSASQLAAFFGASNELLIDTTKYIQGLSIGVLPLLMLSSLMVFLQMHNKSNISLFSSILIAILSLTFGLLNALVFKSDIRGIGLASSFSNYLTVLFIIGYLLKNKGLIDFSPKLFRLEKVKDILVYGSPTSLASILYAVRNAFINGYALNVGGEVAVSALAILGACGVFFDAFNIGTGNVMAMLASMFIGEKDTNNLKKMMKISVFVGLVFAAIKLLAAYIFGDKIAILFGASDNIVPLTRQLLYYYCWSAPFNIITVLFISVFQSLGRVIFCNIRYLLNCILVPLFCCVVLTKFLGIKGIWILYAFSEIVTITSILISACIKKRGLVKTIEEIFMLGNDFNMDNKISISIDEIDEVVDISKKIQNFCNENNIEHRRSMLAALCMEEMAGNVIDHGFKKDNKNHELDIFAGIDDGDIILRLRDNCIPFDPKSKLEMVNDDDPVKNIGIKMVSKLAKEMNYQTTFGMNVLTIKI